MTPKEKAEELIDKFSERRKLFTETKGWIIHVDSSKAKRHALTAVDIIISNNQTICGKLISDVNENTAYWCEVELHLKNIITR